jgi:hypothetical protein
MSSFKSGKTPGNQSLINEIDRREAMKNGPIGNKKDKAPATGMKEAPSMTPPRNQTASNDFAAGGDLKKGGKPFPPKARAVEYPEDRETSGEH